MISLTTDSSHGLAIKHAPPGGKPFPIQRFFWGYKGYSEFLGGSEGLLTKIVMEEGNRLLKNDMTAKSLNFLILLAREQTEN